MGIVVNTNIQSIFAQRALSHNTLDLQRNLERLSTGFRINRAADDAAGLSISEKLTTRLIGFEKATQNAGDGISLIQTAEGALSIIQENLQRVRELVVQAINGTNSANEKNALQREINERIKVIDDIATSTEFNSIQLLDGNTAANSNIVLQTGPDSGEITTLRFQAGTTSQANTGINIDVDFQVQNGSSDYGQLIEGLGGSVGNVALSEIHIQGATVDSLAVAETRTVGGTGTAANVDVGPSTTFNLNHVDIMIDNVSRMRSELGAMQNALESKVSYMGTAAENAAASRSRIRDVDVARESSMLVKNQILQQSAAAMLSQANATPQIALQLLG